MKGFPKTLNTKSDYEYVKTHFPAEDYIPVFKDLLDTEYDWFFERNLLDNEEVVEDSFHKVVESSFDSTKEPTKALYVYKSNPACKMYSLGYTREEVLSIAGLNTLAYVGLR